MEKYMRHGKISEAYKKSARENNQLNFLQKIFVEKINCGAGNINNATPNGVQGSLLALN